MKVSLCKGRFRGPFSPAQRDCAETLVAPSRLLDELRLCHIRSMRLSAEQAEAIRQCVRRFDPEAQVLLFGSRADDNRRGGDIDLLILSKRIGLAERLQLQSALEDALGLQKIDLVIVAEVESNPFAKFVHGRSVPL